MHRRGFLTACIASAMAPALVRASSLMPVRQIVPGDAYIVTYSNMPAVEVLARQEEWLARTAALVRAEMLINPPIIDLGYGRCELLHVPDFKLVIRG